VQPTTHDALQDALEGFIEKPQPLLIEVCTNRKENVELHAKITEILKEALYAPA